MPAEKLTFCIGNQAAHTAVSLINQAAHCPALTAYDLRWRRHDGQRPGEVAPDVTLECPLLDCAQEHPVPSWPGLHVELTEQQRKSLRWMLRKEAGTEDELVVEHGCQDSSFSTHRGVDFQFRLCFTLRGGILADAMGYGKTLLAIAVMAASCVTPMECRNARPLCGASLIFVPPNLVCQWLAEFKKALGDYVQVRFFGLQTLNDGGEGVSVSNGPSSEAGVARKSPPEFGGRPPGGDAAEGGGSTSSRLHVYAAASTEGWAQLMREASWADALAIIVPYPLLRDVEPWFCLHTHHWRRIIVDELHEVLESRQIADALSLISAQHLWGLSGTLPVSTTGDVAQLAALFGVQMPIDADNARRFLDCYVRRNSNPVTNTIPIDEHRFVVTPTPMERAIYLACQHDFDQGALGMLSDTYVPAFLTTWRGLQEHGREAALVKLCCHHQITTNDIELLSTPEQSVERLCVWKSHHCKEARQLVRRHALLAEWMRRHVSDEAPADGSGTMVVLPGRPRGGDSDREAWDCATAEVTQASALDDDALLEACRGDLEVTPFAICEHPADAEYRWLEWCAQVGLEPGTRGAISRLRKIMYDELWGRLVDGVEGWAGLAKMGHRCWRGDYAAAQRSRLLEVTKDYASSLRSCRFLESVMQQATSKQGLDCGICLHPLCAPCVTPCAHIFCASCIEQCLKSQQECPQCRAPVRGRSQLSMLKSSVHGAGPVQGGDASANLDHPCSDAVAGSEGDCCRESQADRPIQEPEFGSKISALVTRLKAIQRVNEKAVVFAQWQDLIFKIHAALTKFGVPAAVLAGGAFDRASVLQRFESPELPVLLLSLEDSASGTNMAHASHVLLVHPMVAASPEEQQAYEAQAIGRVRRWGQLRRVKVWRYIMEGTIEADLAAAHAA